MPAITINLQIKAAFTQDRHRDAIVQTVRQEGQHVLTNIMMLSATNSRIPPRIRMTVQEQGSEEVEFDIVQEVKEATIAALADEEDPFA